MFLVFDVLVFDVSLSEQASDAANRNPEPSRAAGPRAAGSTILELTDCSDFPNLDFLLKPLHGGAVRPIRVRLVKLSSWFSC